MNMNQTLQYLRNMKIQDLSEVMRGELASYPHPWTEGIFSDCILSNYYLCWVLELENHIRGHAVMSATAGEAHLLNLCIYPDLQGKGWGRKILIEVENIAKQNHAETCFLEVRPSNHVGLHLYQNMGYNEIGLRKNYYPADNNGREDAIVMAKTLFAPEAARNK